MRRFAARTGSEVLRDAGDWTRFSSLALQLHFNQPPVLVGYFEHGAWFQVHIAGEIMRERFEAVIEHATGRRVIGFMSGNQQHPDMMCEVFILAPTDLVDDYELSAVGSLPAPP